MLRPWYAKYGIEPPFPWLGISCGILLGLTLAIVAPWLLFNLRDTNLLNTR